MMRWGLVLAGIVASATAQVLAKLAAQQAVGSVRWWMHIVASAGCYGAAFLLYAAILRVLPLSRISPAMTVAVAAIVVACGVGMGERLLAHHWMGLAFCLAGFLLLVRG